MKSAITSIEKRAAGDIILFNIDEGNYSPEFNRVVTKNSALDGTVLVTNWGYPEGNRIISLKNILLSRTNYDILIAMKEDNNYDFLFHYLNNTWAIVVRNVSGTQERDKMKTTISLTVISKYSPVEVE
jgi:hypothetical protein